MINNPYYDELRALLEGGKTVEELAQEFADALNAASADLKKAERDAQMHAEIEDLTHAMNLALENYSKLYGNEKWTGNNFTIQEVFDIVKAKFEGKNQKVCADLFGVNPSTSNILAGAPATDPAAPVAAINKTPKELENALLELCETVNWDDVAEFLNNLFDTDK